MSLSLLAMIAAIGSSAIDTLRVSLESESAFWFDVVKYAGYAVSFGCALEAPETLVTMKRWWLLRFRDIDKEESREDKKKWFIPLAAAGLLIIVIGILVETYAEARVSDVEARIRSHESEKISSAEIAAGAAIERAATVDQETQGLATDAADAKRDMTQAQLELARFTGPIQSVPVVNGVANPDPTKGSKLRILLHADTVIKFPTLPKGKALSWTLFIVEDEVGQHQFTTFPKQFMPGEPGHPNVLFMPPGSSATMDLVTDETGTSDHTFGGATLAVTPPKTVEIK